jgi:hypothetical protein
MIGELNASLRECLAASDVNGLLGIQAMALAIAQAATDPALAKKAQRIAKKAGSCAVRLQRQAEQQLANDAARLELEAQVPLVGEPPPAPLTAKPAAATTKPAAPTSKPAAPPAKPAAATARPSETAATPRTRIQRPRTTAATPRTRVQEPSTIEVQLSSRLLRLLDLLLNPQQPAPKRAGTLRALADGTTAAPIDFPTLVRSWLPLLVRGYQEGVRLSAPVPLGVVKHRHEQQIEAELRSTATELISAGADPRGLTADAVPLIAYSLLIETLPTAIDADSAEAADKFNVLLLGMPEDLSSIPTEQRRLFIELLKLAVILGEAQAFADQLSLNRLSLDQARPSTGTSSYMVGIGLLVVGVAVIGLLLGLVIGQAQTPAHAGAHARTITRTETVAHTKTIVRNETTTVTSPRAASSHPGNGSSTRPVTVTVTPPAAVAPADTVTVTRTVGNPTVRTVGVVPPACTSAIGKAQSLTTMAVGDLTLITEYAQLASQAIPAAAKNDTAAIKRITARIQAIDSTLSQRAANIAQVGKAFGDGAAACLRYPQPTTSK